ncbi:MAG: hypothetical protein LBF60_07665 [Treponema sp.]|nr:hypothetical protein [Treponema sp.]
MLHKAMAIAAILLMAAGGCTSAPEKRMEKIAATAPDAAAWLINAFKTKKIIFINETHVTANEEIFLAEHMRAFYDAGVRYIFTESDLAANDQFMPSYPWMLTGGRVEDDDMKHALLSLEQTTRETDPFMVIAAEAGAMISENFANLVDWLNYRDEYAAATIIETLNNARPDAKALILYGGYHGIKIVYDESLDNGAKVKRTPLGYRLAEHYGAAFISLGFFSGIHIGRDDLADEWRRLISGPRIVLSKDSGALQDVLGPWETWTGYYDGFITEGDARFGTIRNYVPSDENIRFMTRFLKEYARKDPKWDEYPRREMDAAYLIMCYYLKLYYGSLFDYTIWRKPGAETGRSLLQAVEELEAYAFAENRAPSELIEFHYTRETMRQYCAGMYYSLLTELLEYGRPIAEIQTPALAALQNARALFPEDIWPLYWMAFIQTETGAYREGLSNFQELFANDLSWCMSILPLAYKKAGICAAELGDQGLAEEYTALSESLYNEQDADPAHGPFSVETGHLFGNAAGQAFAQ